MSNIMTTILFCFVTFAVVYGDVFNLQYGYNYSPKTPPVLENTEFQYQPQSQYEPQNVYQPNYDNQQQYQSQYELPNVYQPNYGNQPQYQPLQQYQFSQQYQPNQQQQYQPNNLEIFYQNPLTVQEESGYQYNPPQLQGLELIPSTPAPPAAVGGFGRVSEVNANVLKSLVG